MELFAGQVSCTVVGQRGVDWNDCLATFGCLTLILVRPPIQCVSIGWEPLPLLLDAILRKPPTKMLFPPLPRAELVTPVRLIKYSLSLKLESLSELHKCFKRLELGYPRGGSLMKLLLCSCSPNPCSCSF